jgi:hypothetical protein
VREVDLLVFLVVFVHREIDDPRQRVLILVDQVQLLADLGARESCEFPELCRVAGDEERGIAPGIDRIVMLLAGEENLREVVLFPMNQRAEDLLMGAPSEVTPKQLRDLHIRLALPQK